MATPLKSQTDQGLTEVIAKLDELLAFQRQLAPYLPLLGKLAAFADNPAARFRAMALGRKGEKNGG